MKDQNIIHHNLLQILNKEIRGLVSILLGLVLYWISPPPTHHKRILLFRPERMGDFLVFTPLLRNLRKKFPDHEIRVVISTEIKFLTKINSDADGYFVLDRERRYEIRSRFRNLMRIRNWGAGTAIYPSKNRETWVDEMMIWSGAPIRMGLLGTTYLTRSWILHLGQLCYNRLIRKQAYSEMDNMQRVLEELGVESPMEAIPKIDHSPKTCSRAVEILRELQLHPEGKRWALVAPIAKDKIRKWTPEGFTEIIRRLNDRKGLSTILVGAREDAEDLDSIRKKCADLPVHVHAGTLTILELAALVRHAEVFIGVESGPLHLAAASGVPIVCIMGGGIFGQFFPYGNRQKNRVAYKKLPCYGCGWKCIHDTVRCLQEIEADQVWDEVTMALKAGSAI